MTTKLTDILWNSYATTIPTLKLKKKLGEDKDPDGRFDSIKMPYEFIITSKLSDHTNYEICLFNDPLVVSFGSLDEIEEAFNFNYKTISKGGMKFAKTKKNKTRRKK